MRLSGVLRLSTYLRVLTAPGSSTRLDLNSSLKLLLRDSNLAEVAKGVCYFRSSHLLCWLIQETVPRQELKQWSLTAWHGWRSNGFKNSFKPLPTSLTSAVVPLSKYSHLNKHETQHTVTPINTPSILEKSDPDASLDPLQIQAELSPRCGEQTTGMA